MNVLLEQAVIAHKLGFYRSWHEKLSTTEKEELERQINDVIKPLIQTFANIGAKFVELGNTIIEGIDLGLEKSRQ